MGQVPGVLPTALLGPDRMSDWLEETAGRAAPSGGAIVDHIKDGAWQGRGRRGADGQAAEDAALPTRTTLAHLLHCGLGF